MTTRPIWYQSACTHPLLKGQRPSTTSSSPSRRARPIGANMLVDTRSLASPAIARATDGSSQEKKAVELPINTDHPADPSP
jgi:hypothetical protein